MQTPRKALAALLHPRRKALTLGRLALLEWLGAPLLRGEWQSLHATATALWALEAPYGEVVGPSEDERLARALAWVDSIGAAEYRRRLSGALDGIAEFYAMLPRADAEESKKKGSATGSSPNSASGTAAHTPGGSTTPSGGTPPSTSPCSTDAGPRASADAAPEP